MNYTYWWNMYGAFAEGEDDLPHTGQVIMHYMKLAGLKPPMLREKFAEAGWDIGQRRVEQFISQSNTSQPQDFSRRKLLCKVLAIPPALMGLGVISNWNASTVSSKPKFDKDEIMQAEMSLASFWDNFYGSAIQKHASGVRLWRDNLATLAETTNETASVQTLLCKFDQLVAVTARDKADYVTAMYFHNESVELAQELRNAELLATSLFRRARAYIQQKKLNLAMDDMKTALPYARRCRDNLRGYIFQMTAQLITLMPKTHEMEKLFRQFMDEPSAILSKGTPEDDGSFVRLTLAGYQQDRARGLLKLGDTSGALDAIAVAEKVHQPNMLRWQGELSLLRAQAYAKSGDVEWACYQIEESVQLARSTQSAI